jgi:lysophospholipase L1-like esterase
MFKKFSQFINLSLCLAIVSSFAFAATDSNNLTANQPAAKQHQPKKNSAIKPAIKQKKELFLKRHQEILDRVKKGNVDLIFVGDSITHYFETTGADVWKQYYAPRNAANLGSAGDLTQHVLWRLDNGELDGISPKVAVVMIGTNNQKTYTADQISDGIVAVCQNIRQKLPETKILLLAVFARQPQPCDIREKLAQASKTASKIADNKNIFYLDINDKFYQSDGSLSKEIMSVDFVHPTAKGYQIWASAMEPTLAKLLGDKEITPIKN